ncbi:MAG: RHS repeat-associated core domain-containing protein, partial [Candidatus Eisenbacteria bacterium]|nr:RHS repeat-associated core domain-containing protein [Candidatus Eisenbacteria bacterium]
LLYYGYRYYSPELGRWLSRDPIQERGGRNLYVCGRNNLIVFIDPLGLACQKTHGEGINWRAEAAAYEGIGATVSLGVFGTVYDCCCDSDLVPDDAYDITVEGSVSIGLGWGGHVVVPIVGRVGLTIMGPQYTKSSALSFSKECGDPNPSLTWTIIEISGDVGGSFAIGESFGASIGYWAKYGISFDLAVANRTATLTGNVGWKGGGEWEVNTPIVNIHGEFALFGYQWQPPNLSTSW